MGRYPDYVCEECVERKTTLSGERIEFYNESISGGLVAYRFNIETGKFDIEDTQLSEDPVVLIDGVRCYAAEAHFGGVVIRKEKI
jgi:hypothetical protein